MNEKCAYYGEYRIVNNCEMQESCRVKECLDEIEEISKDKLNEGCSIRNKDCDFSCNKCLFETLDKILRIIKQAKEGIK